MIILLNGTSSSGKTSIAKELQKIYNGVLLLYGVDMLVQTAFPEKCDFPPFDEKGMKVIMHKKDNQPHAEIIISQYMYPVYETAVKFYKSLSGQGYNLIVDEVLFDENRIKPYFDILAEETVYFIGIKPEKKIAVEWEKKRGDRLVGLAAGLYNRVYDSRFVYDLVIDTGKIAPNKSANKILTFIEENKKPEGFICSTKNWI